MAEIEFTDRYGGHYPDPATVCKGKCEGMGVYPEQCNPFLTPAGHQCDGWHFMPCPDCGGTGKAAVEPGAS